MVEPNSNVESSAPDRVTLIDSVNTPLGFFVLMVTVVESGMLLALSLGKIPQQLEMFIGIGALVLLCLLIIVVTGIALCKPEVLSGKHYSIDNLARALGVDIFWAFQRYVSNLEDADEREEAFRSLVRKIESKTDVAHRRIRKKIVEVLKERANAEW